MAYLVTNIPCISSNSPIYRIAIVVKVNANSLPTLFAATKNQWSLLVYLKIKKQISISYKKSYVNNENIYQYGYLMYGLKITIWKMGSKWNCGQNLPSKLLDSYFMFPTQMVGGYDLIVQSEVELFIDNYKNSSMVDKQIPPQLYRRYQKRCGQKQRS